MSSATELPASGLFNVPGAFAGNRLDWRIVGDYRFSDSFLAYASVSTGFKGGGVNPRPFFGLADAGLPPFAVQPDQSFNPETSPMKWASSPTSLIVGFA